MLIFIKYNNHELNVNYRNEFKSKKSKFVKMR